MKQNTEQNPVGESIGLGEAMETMGL